MFNDSDLKQIRSQGLDIEILQRQIENFRKGFPFARLDRAATSGDGIITFAEDQITELVNYYDNYSSGFSIMKFVPASGAASRMFQALFSYLEKTTTPEKEIEEFEKDKGFNSVYHFIIHLKEFAFYDDLVACFPDKEKEIEEHLKGGNFSKIISHLLTDAGLNYGKLPKGLLRFHRYPENSRFSFEEHLVEAIRYGKSKNNRASIHFTVSPEHLDLFKEKVAQVSPLYEKMSGVVLDCSFSVQKPSTDTIAVDPDNQPFREDDGSLLFRPGGHGALIENLNDLDAAIVFIKNIDNIVPDRLKGDTIKYKKAIGGLLIKLQTSVFAFLEELENGCSTDRCNEIAEFAETQLSISLPVNFRNLEPVERRELLIHYLDRPIRICGMVKNEGEPGGGPFWVRNSKGNVSLQIVESSQVNMRDPKQVEIMKTATHFNPVDLVCGIRNYRGERFNLLEYIDPETGFISEKSKNGRRLKAQELPGLWNGAMADWITLFVEVPIITFNPVKTVNDLLRPQHQPGE